ncbi:alpha-(1,6)-fucosyltransferase-like [Mya arenaria]|uniref:alpha-(1,6)-fucosyltransferase-like n=1 Tax=Mya arenaria TaxID=6604 RepID=UPI0022E906B1|nr:alpha-(1,6)-fucosyltransferase-like [Mya arenaria]
MFEMNVKDTFRYFLLVWIIFIGIWFLYMNRGTDRIAVFKHHTAFKIDGLNTPSANANTYTDSVRLKEVILNFTDFAESCLRHIVNATNSDTVDKTLDEINHFRRMFKSIGLTGSPFNALLNKPGIDLKQGDVILPSLSCRNNTNNISLTHDVRRELVLRYEKTFYNDFPDFIRRRFEMLRMNATNTSIAKHKLKKAVEEIMTNLRTFKHEYLKLQISRSKANIWKRTKSLELQKNMWSFLKETQDLATCNSTKTLTCLHVYGTGFGSFVHRNVFCLAAAIFSRRTMVINERSLKYFENHTHVYFPLKNLSNVHCLKRKSRRIFSDSDFAKHESLEDVSLRAVETSIVDPLEIPAPFVNQIGIFHSYPPAFWIGLLSNMLFEEDIFEKQLLKYMNILKFTSPIVGVHIRRTDKIQQHEARFHTLSEYIFHVANWYDAYEAVHGFTQRTVFLASDSPDVFEEAVKEYPNYTFIFNNQTLPTADSEDHKSMEELPLHGIVFDIQLLSRCEFIVCTMSSNVCRLAYELMQLHHGDASEKVVSLDIDYYFFKHLPRMYTAIIAHSFPFKGEITFEEGDVILVKSGDWRTKQTPGFLFGKNRRTGDEGLVPRFKIVEIFKRRIIE